MATSGDFHMAIDIEQTEGRWVVSCLDGKLLIGSEFAALEWRGKRR